MEKNDFLDFYENKSVIHSYNFSVEFTGFHFHAIKPFHILDIEIPTIKIQRKSVNYGVTQFSHPVIADDQPLDIKITFEEDRSNTIGELLSSLWHTVAHGGYHRTIKEMREFFGNIEITMSDEQKLPICSWTYKNIFFLGYDNISLSYDSNDTLKYVATFGSDVVQYANFYSSSINDNNIAGEYGLDESSYNEFYNDNSLTRGRSPFSIQ